MFGLIVYSRCITDDVTLRDGEHVTRVTGNCITELIFRVILKIKNRYLRGFVFKYNNFSVFPTDNHKKMMIRITIIIYRIKIQL